MFNFFNKGFEKIKDKGEDKESNEVIKNYEVLNKHSQVFYNGLDSKFKNALRPVNKYLLPLIITLSATNSFSRTDINDGFSFNKPDGKEIKINPNSKVKDGKTFDLNFYLRHLTENKKGEKKFNPGVLVSPVGIGFKYGDKIIEKNAGEQGFTFSPNFIDTELIGDINKKSFEIKDSIKNKLIRILETKGVYNATHDTKENFLKDAFSKLKIKDIKILGISSPEARKDGSVSVVPGNDEIENISLAKKRGEMGKVELIKVLKELGIDANVISEIKAEEIQFNNEEWKKLVDLANGEGIKGLKEQDKILVLINRYNDGEYKDNEKLIAEMKKILDSKRGIKFEIEFEGEKKTEAVIPLPLLLLLLISKKARGALDPRNWGKFFRRIFKKKKKEEEIPVPEDESIEPDPIEPIPTEQKFPTEQKPITEDKDQIKSALYNPKHPTEPVYTEKPKIPIEPIKRVEPTIPEESTIVKKPIDEITISETIVDNIPDTYYKYLFSEKDLDAEKVAGKNYNFYELYRIAYENIDNVDKYIIRGKFLDDELYSRMDDEEYIRNGLDYRGLIDEVSRVLAEKRYKTEEQIKTDIALGLLNMWETYDRKVRKEMGLEINQETTLDYEHDEKKILWAKIGAEEILELAKKNDSPESMREELVRRIEEYEKEKETYIKKLLLEAQNKNKEIEEVAGDAKEGKAGFKENISEIDPFEYDNLKSDLDLINKSIQNSTGIVSLDKLDFKSEFGRGKYEELKSIGEDKEIPLTFNKEELKIIGDEIENILSKNNRVELGKEIEEAYLEERDIWREFQDFVEQNPDEDIPEELEYRYRKAEEKLKIAREIINIRNNKEEYKEKEGGYNIDYFLNLLEGIEKKLDGKEEIKEMEDGGLKLKKTLEGRKYHPIQKNKQEKNNGVYNIDELSKEEIVKKLEELKGNMTKTQIDKLEKYMGYSQGKGENK